MKSFRNMGIGTKLVLTISSLAALAVVALVLVITLRVVDLAQKDAITIARETARSNGNSLKAFLESPHYEALSLAKVFEAASVVANAGISRRQANSILEYFIGRSPGYLGVYVAFEPDAYDGKDKNFIDETGHDGTGRFIPYWTRNEKGETDLSALVDYEKPGAGDWYLVPKATGRPAIIDPFFYEIQGRKVLMTSLVCPVFNAKKAFIGIAGIDLALSEVEKQVVGATLYRTGHITLYSANGTVAGDRDPARVGKNASEVDKTLAERVKAGASFVLMRPGASGQRMLTIGEPFEIGETGAKWMVAADIPTAEIFAPVTTVILTIIGAGALAVLLIVVVVVLLARSVTRPMRAALQAAATIASGDLTVSVESRSEDETGRLLRAMGDMAGKLREVVEQVSRAAGRVSSGSAQLSQNAQTLSNGATQQAAAGEEVSSSMEEMVSSIRQNAENASQSEKMASRVSRDAADGGRMVMETVGAMKEIATKISIIEEIARQTNLLALNAAIEAARAGEQGKGFAVVASEVRKLAERSQKAAGEINTYTASSVQKAESAGDRLLKLVPEIQKTAELVQEISAASSEQNTGADQIGRAVAQLDTVIQQNAANSEELASTAEELNAQASLLQTAMAFFTVEKGGPTGGAGRTEPRAVPRRPPVLMHPALPARPPAAIIRQETGITVAPPAPRPAADRGGSGGETDDDFEQF
jgi:methyl-accepting chemotaxis protein